jgi:hypothetical protein
VCDDSSFVLAALAIIVPFITKPIVMKVMAAWKAVTFYGESGFQRVLFEKDALNMVNALCQGDSCWSRFD